VEQIAEDEQELAARAIESVELPRQVVTAAARPSEVRIG
jgi:hypothetical protein